MKSMIEAFTSVFFICIAVVLMISMISGYLCISNARAYHGNVIDRIENSYFDSTTITEIKNEAIQKGYSLSVDDVTQNQNRKCYYVKLYYEISIKAFRLIGKFLDYKGVIEGYAT